MSIGLIAAATLSAGIALVALALVLSARRHLRQSLAVGLFGLMTLAGSSTWMALASAIVPNSTQRPKPPEAHETAPGPKVADMDSRLSQAVEQKRIAEQERDAALQRAAQAREEARIAFESQGREHEALQGRLAHERGQREIQEAKVRELEAEVNRARSKANTQEAPSADTLRRVMASTAYSIHPLDHPELVAGLRGRWYSVRLGSKLTFSDRAFRIPTLDEDLRKAATNFQNEVINGLGATRNEVRFFARGSADERRLSRPADQPSIVAYTVLPRAANDTFRANSEPRRLTVVDNRDLPNLRALWLVETLRPVLGEVTVLDYEPQGREKSVELLMFMPSLPP